MKYYAGIGSRQTPEHILKEFKTIALTLDALGYILNSGGADGADKAFESQTNNKQIFIPWDGFNNCYVKDGYIVPDFTTEAMAIARNAHHYWYKCSKGAKLLHCRNVYQVLGKDLHTPVDFIVCWTPYGNGAGGTGQAIRIAKSKNIPVYDLGSNTGLLSIYKRIDTLEKSNL